MQAGIEVTGGTEGALPSDAAQFENAPASRTCSTARLDREQHAEWIAAQNAAMDVHGLWSDELRTW
jgi:hypothetical protein